MGGRGETVWNNSFKNGFIFLKCTDCRDFYFENCTDCTDFVKKFNGLYGLFLKMYGFFSKKFWPP